MRAREDGEPRERDVPDDFDPRAHGLDNLRTLHRRMTDADHRWCVAILARETTYPVPPGYFRIGRFHELEQLPPGRLREQQYLVASRNGHATGATT